MTLKTTLASLLSAHMENASLGDARLANQVNSLVGNAYFIHRSTIRNWRTGTAQKVNDWRKLVAVAVTLGLDEAETDALLGSGKCPPIKTLSQTSQATDQAFFKYWQHAAEFTSVKEPPSSSQLPGTNEVQPPKTSAHPSKSNFWAHRSSRISIVGCLILLLGVTTGFSKLQSNSHSGNPKNLLINSNFEQGANGWISYVNEAAAANFKIADETAHVEITQPTEKGWHISLTQKGLELTAGNVYTARFRARGTKGTSLEVNITRVANPKTSLAFINSDSQKYSITENWATKTIEFESIETIGLNDGGARLFIKFGNSNKGWIMLDDIEFFEGQLTSE